MEGSRSDQMALLRGALAREQKRVQELERERAQREGSARRKTWTGTTLLEAEVMRGRRWRMQLFRELRGCRQALQLERERRHQREHATRQELRKAEYQLQVARLETRSTQEALDTAVRLVHEQGVALELLTRRLEDAEEACWAREASSGKMERSMEVLRQSMPFIEQVLHERDSHGSGKMGMKVVDILKRVASL